MAGVEGARGAPPGRIVEIRLHPVGGGQGRIDVRAEAESQVLRLVSSEGRFQLLPLAAAALLLGVRLLFRLGRLAAARPWIFAAWTRAWRPPDSIYRDCALRMVRLLAKHFDPQTALRRLVLFGIYFAPNFRYGHTFATALRRAGDLPEAETILRRFFAADPEVATRPLTSLMR